MILLILPVYMYQASLHNCPKFQKIMWRYV